MCVSRFRHNVLIEACRRLFVMQGTLPVILQNERILLYPIIRWKSGTTIRDGIKSS